MNPARTIKHRALAILLSALLLTGCAAPAAAPADQKQESAPIHITGLSQEEMLEDYEFLWTTLEESYPGWGILHRMGVETDAIHDEYVELIQSSGDDDIFYSALYSTMWRMEQVCHLWLVEPQEYGNYATAYAGDKPYWDQVLNNPVSQASYPKFLELLEQTGALEDSAVSGEAEGAENVTALRLSEDVAYLKINSFQGTMETDAPVIQSFYQSLGDCGNLIIDLTQNSGGSELYWQELLVAPLIDQPLSCTNYALVRRSDNNAPYLDAVFQESELHPIEDLPDLPHLSQEDRAFATHYIESTLSVEPGERAPFRGRVWLLVGEAVYSASESFALFSQQTGFATLVGSTTGGDGVGALDPVFVVLPNSGLLVRYNMLLGLNADGTPNQEAGTTPDLLSPAGEHPLITALRSILS